MGCLTIIKRESPISVVQSKRFCCKSLQTAPFVQPFRTPETKKQKNDFISFLKIVAFPKGQSILCDSVVCVGGLRQLIPAADKVRQ